MPRLFLILLMPSSINQDPLAHNKATSEPATATASESTCRVCHDWSSSNNRLNSFGSSTQSTAQSTRLPSLHSLSAFNVNQDLLAHNMQSIRLFVHGCSQSVSFFPNCEHSFIHIPFISHSLSYTTNVYPRLCPFLSRTILTLLIGPYPSKPLRRSFSVALLCFYIR